MSKVSHLRGFSIEKRSACRGDSNGRCSQPMPSSVITPECFMRFSRAVFGSKASASNLLSVIPRSFKRSWSFFIFKKRGRKYALGRTHPCSFAYYSVVCLVIAELRGHEFSCALHPGTISRTVLRHLKPTSGNCSTGLISWRNR